MKGWLVVNAFLRSEKFDAIYSLLLCAAKEQGAELELVPSDRLLCTTESGFSAFSLPDFVIFWDKDATLAYRLEQAGARVFNSARTVALCDNKILTSVALRGAVRTPETVIAPKTFEGIGYGGSAFLRRAGDLLDYPLVVKEAYGSFGKQVYLARSYAEAEEIVSRIGWKDFLMQKFVRSSVGKDVRVNVAGGRVVSAILRNNPDDFRSNVTNGGTAQAYRPSDAQKKAAIDACRAVGADFAGVDLLFGENGEPIVCEVNSNPHFKSSLDCTGIDLSRALLAHVLESLR
ncbi:MAG: RimK family alpha-L-glutamate ligase [Candidatus Gallimonas sp.]